MYETIYFPTSIMHNWMNQCEMFNENVYLNMAPASNEEVLEISINFNEIENSEDNVQY